MKRILFVVGAAALMCPPAAQAQAERVWLSITTGGSQYAMTEINQEIEASNASTGGDPTFPLVERGLSFGLAAGYEMPSRWNFGAGLERLFAESKTSNSSGSWDYQFTANAWRAFGEYALRGIGQTSLRLGGGLGIISGSGKYTESDPTNGPAEFKMGGSAPLYEAYAGGDCWLAPQFGVTVAGGYRRARLNSVSIDGGTFVSSTTGEALPLDYSGPYVRVGVKLVGKSASD